MTTLPTKHLSICECGFPILKDEIALGTEYDVDLKRMIPMVVTCGGCGTDIRTKAVYAGDREGGGDGGYLPIGIFDLPPVN